MTAFNATSNPERLVGKEFLKSKAAIFQKYLGKWSRWPHKKSQFPSVIAQELEKTPEAQKIRATFTKLEVMRAQAQIKRANTLSAKKANAARNAKPADLDDDEAYRRELNECTNTHLAKMAADDKDEVAMDVLNERAVGAGMLTETVNDLIDRGGWSMLAEQIDELDLKLLKDRADKRKKEIAAGLPAPQISMDVPTEKKNVYEEMDGPQKEVGEEDIRTDIKFIRQLDDMIAWFAKLCTWAKTPGGYWEVMDPIPDVADLRIKLCKRLVRRLKEHDHLAKSMFDEVKEFILDDEHDNDGHLGGVRMYAETCTKCGKHSSKYGSATAV